jgi:hypothetical protein
MFDGEVERLYEGTLEDYVNCDEVSNDPHRFPAATRPPSRRHTSMRGCADRASCTRCRVPVGTGLRTQPGRLGCAHKDPACAHSRCERYCAGDRTTNAACAQCKTVKAHKEAFYTLSLKIRKFGSCAHPTPAVPTRPIALARSHARAGLRLAASAMRCRFGTTKRC